MPQPSNIPLLKVEMDTWSIEKIESAMEDRPLLLLLKRPSDGQENRHRRMIIFVHGLNGSPRTWLPFLSKAFISPELRGFDFGLFHYQTSATSRINIFQRLPRVEDWARVLTNVISQTVLGQERFHSFILVGHSMGGLVCKFSVRYLLETNKESAMRIHSLFTYGTPHLGSDRANFIGALFSPDLAFLRAFSPPIHELQTFWNSQISAMPSVPGKLTIHERAVVSVKDYWVPLSSSVSSLGEHFILRSSSSHTELHKPMDVNDPRIRWFVDQVVTIQKQTECSLIGIMNSPKVEDYMNFNIRKFFECLFILDVGSIDGATKGDLFALFYEHTPVKDQNGNIVDWIEGSMSLIKAVDVKERSTYCKLENFPVEPVIQLLNAGLENLKDQGIEEVTDSVFEKIFLSLFGKFARKIPRKESDAAEEVEEIYGNVLEEADKTRKNKKLQELIMACRNFLQSNPGSLLAESAAFHEAWASLNLERYEEAEELFRNFTRDYPFSVSIPGAQEFIEEIRFRQNLRDSGGSDKAQLELVEYLLTDNRNLTETLKLTFEVTDRNPAIVTKISPNLRFMLTLYLFGDLLGLDINDEDKFKTINKNYLEDKVFRENIITAIQEKTNPERAKFFIAMLS